MGDDIQSIETKTATFQLLLCLAGRTRYGATVIIANIDH